MSQVGKSTLAPRFVPYGYELFSVDAIIEDRLKQILEPLGLSGTRGLAEWMGQPGDKRYRANSATYIRLETEIMLDAVKRMESGQRLVLDTTGSVINLNPELLRRFKSVARILHLRATPEIQHLLYELYKEEPKPVVWSRGVYRRRKDESPTLARKRCYPRLLSKRVVLYDELAHEAVDYTLIRQSNFDMPQVFDLLS
jgi:hypothetical protein